MKRYFHIDFLRAIAIIVIIATHVFSYNLSSPVINFLWNYSHFTVAAFVLCSGYVLYASYHEKIHTMQDVYRFYKKRLIRLLLPFYEYLFIHYVLMLLFPTFFSGLGLSLSFPFVLQSISLIGGISLNWLPLLFIQLALVFPLLIFFWKKKKVQRACIAILLVYVIATTIWIIPYRYYRWTMWIPWLFVFLLSFFLFQKEKNKSWNVLYFFGVAILFFAIWYSLFIIWQHAGRPLNLIDNKYPPNWYSLSFELFGTFLVLGLGAFSFYPSIIKRILLFISTSSYQLFFIHYIVLDLVLSLEKNNRVLSSPYLQVCIVLGVSIVLAGVLAQRKRIIPGLGNQ